MKPLMFTFICIIMVQFNIDIVLSQTTQSLSIDGIIFDPISKGKNAFEVKVKNHSIDLQILAIHIYTNSFVGPGDVRRGWGTTYFENVPPTEEKGFRIPFRIMSKIKDNTYIRIRFSNPVSPEAHKSEDFFLEKEYYGVDLPELNYQNKLQARASNSVFEEILNQFNSFKAWLQTEQYEFLWKAFTKEYQQAMFFGESDSFEKKVTQKWLPYGWIRDDFLNLKPEEVVEIDNLIILNANLKEMPWKIVFVRELGQYKIDKISGYIDGVFLWENWMSRIIPTMKKRVTPHFQIYYESNTAADRDIEHIVKKRELGYKKIDEFLGQKSNDLITIIFFNDSDRKTMETGHAGGGWAFDNTIVEVYNDERQGDPYHETVHILSRNMGYPPAAFFEGIAVYLSELLGNPALKTLGGRNLGVYERIKEINKEGGLISLRDLIVFTNIGHEESKPEISYAEAGAFVKYLIEVYGKDKFFELYKSLNNSEDAEINEKNLRNIERIIGKSIEELEQEWLIAIGIK